MSIQVILTKTATLYIARRRKQKKGNNMKAENGLAKGVRGMVSAWMAMALCCAYASTEAAGESDGGVVEIPGKGCVAIVDCRGDAAGNEIGEPLAKLESFTHVRFVRHSCNGFILGMTPHETMTETGAQAALFIVDDKALPMSLLATESNWGVVNLAALREDGIDPSVLASRVQKEFMRVAVLTLGAWRSDMQGSFLMKVTGQKDLDRLKGRGMTLFELRNIMNHLLDIGITRPSSVTYGDLCRNGKAPAPTNDVQRTIWEKVRSDKERGPTNPITIPPPKAKGK